MPTQHTDADCRPDACTLQPLPQVLHSGTARGTDHLLALQSNQADRQGSNHNQSSHPGSGMSAASNSSFCRGRSNHGSGKENLPVPASADSSIFSSSRHDKNSTAHMHRNLCQPAPALSPLEKDPQISSIISNAGKGGSLHEARDAVKACHNKPDGKPDLHSLVDQLRSGRAAQSAQHSIKGARSDSCSFLDGRDSSGLHGEGMQGNQRGSSSSSSGGGFGSVSVATSSTNQSGSGGGSGTWAGQDASCLTTARAIAARLRDKDDASKRLAESQQLSSRVAAARADGGRQGGSMHPVSSCSSSSSSPSPGPTGHPQAARLGQVRG